MVTPHGRYHSNGEKVVRRGGGLRPTRLLPRTPIFVRLVRHQKIISGVTMCVEVHFWLRILFKQFISEKIILMFSDFSIFTNVCKREREREKFRIFRRKMQKIRPKLYPHTKNHRLRPPRIFTKSISRKTTFQLGIFSVQLWIFYFQ